MNTPLAIEAHGLRKEFGQTVAVRGLDLEVAQGEVFGFLGPNGAGKTTSIKMFLDLVRPSAGRVRILGQDASRPSARRRVGFLPEHFRFHEWLRASEFLELHAHLYGLPAAQIGPRCSELLERVGLAEFRERPIRTFSKGMLQRIGLAQALLNHPLLVFLDEPTSGLDPVGRRMVRDVMRDLRQEGTTVFLNSHLLSEVEVTCDRVAFIKFGEVLRVDALSGFAAGEISLAARVADLSTESLNGLSAWGHDVRLDGENLHMVVQDEEALPIIQRYLVEHGARVYAFVPQKISLEDLFIQVVGTDGGL
jgi:ABC-2 type transport system ATP-binding protein